ncbi:hypothetical protein [Geodermatophilus sp. SYSU D01119]
MDPVAFWSPLTMLTFGILGWVRPDVGIQRWVTAGRPTDSSALTVLDRWWGDDALALTAWAQRSGSLGGYAQEIARRTATDVGGRPTTPPVRLRPEWEAVFTGGADPLHLGHVLGHLLAGPLFDESPEPAGSLMHHEATGDEREASFVLDVFSGWYAALARRGAQLPARPDGRSWRVHVTVKPLGYLGAYRRSRVTGRWFTGRHTHHMFGWPG